MAQKFFVSEATRALAAQCLAEEKNSGASRQVSFKEVAEVVTTFVENRRREQEIPQEVISQCVTV